MPRAKPLPIDEMPPSQITHESRVYVDQDAYLQSMGRAAYTKAQLAAARRGGLPHVTKEYSGKKVHYYNVPDCQAYHAGEDI